MESLAVFRVAGKREVWERTPMGRGRAARRSSRRDVGGRGGPHGSELSQTGTHESAEQDDERHSLNDGADEACRLFEKRIERTV